MDVSLSETPIKRVMLRLKSLWLVRSPDDLCVSPSLDEVRPRPYDSVKSLLGTKQVIRKLGFHESVAVRTGIAELSYERAGQNLTTAYRPRRYGVA